MFGITENPDIRFFVRDPDVWYNFNDIMCDGYGSRMSRSRSPSGPYYRKLKERVQSQYLRENSGAGSHIAGKLFIHRDGLPQLMTTQVRIRRRTHLNLLMAHEIETLEDWRLPKYKDLRPDWLDHDDPDPDQYLRTQLKAASAYPPAGSQLVPRRALLRLDDSKTKPYPVYHVRTPWGTQRAVAWNDVLPNHTTKTLPVVGEDLKLVLLDGEDEDDVLLLPELTAERLMDAYKRRSKTFVALRSALNQMKESAP